MNVEVTSIIVAATYKFATLIAGIILSYMGYRLFMAGIWGNAGDLDVKFKSNKLIVKSAAPGTFFVLFGTIVICFSIFKGMKIDKKTISRDVPKIVKETKEDKNELPAKPPF